MLRSLAFDPWGQVPDHGDFGPHNTLFEGIVLTGVVDWDDAVIQDRSVTLGIVVAEVLALEIPIEQRRVLVSRLIEKYADKTGFSVSECQSRALPHSLSRTLDWLCYQKGAPAEIHISSLEELMYWG